MVIMIYHLKTPTLIASLFLLPSVHAIGIRSETSLLPRQPSSATCGYTAAEGNEYFFTLTLPGVWWKAVCPEPYILGSIMEEITDRCMRTWSQNRSPRKLEGAHYEVQGEHCHVTITVVAQPEEDLTFPRFTDDCILEPRPEPCGIAPSLLPWPSRCVPLHVGLYFKMILPATHAASLTNTQTDATINGPSPTAAAKAIPAVKASTAIDHSDSRRAPGIV